MKTVSSQKLMKMMPLNKYFTKKKLLTNFSSCGTRRRRIVSFLDGEGMKYLFKGIIFINFWLETFDN
jgi:hypothetical protein